MKMGKIGGYDSGKRLAKVKSFAWRLFSRFFQVYVVWKLIADDILEVYMSMMAGMDMGRILLDLSDEVIKRLDDLKVQRNLPRAELLREAVEQYLERQDQAETTISRALGLWQGCEEDGVEYQRKLREEW
jgi:hypothetical protein